LLKAGAFCLLHPLLWFMFIFFSTSTCCVAE
jgi:hypothetical protein